MRLSSDEAPGKYEIDRNRYPGQQADWQHATYRMELTDEELILRDVRTETVWRYPIEWHWGGRWDFKNAEVRHHLVRNGPTLYRKKFSYHYVFESPLYGNVFFRRESAWLTWLLWGGALVGLGLWGWWCIRGEFRLKKRAS